MVGLRPPSKSYPGSLFGHMAFQLPEPGAVQDELNQPKSIEAPIR